jgi:hypothetical protein
MIFVLVQLNHVGVYTALEILLYLQLDLQLPPGPLGTNPRFSGREKRRLDLNLPTYTVLENMSSTPSLHLCSPPLEVPEDVLPWI